MSTLASLIPHVKRTVLPMRRALERSPAILVARHRGATQHRQHRVIRKPRAREVRCPASRGVARSADSGGTDPPEADKPPLDIPDGAGPGPRHISIVLGAYFDALLTDHPP
ncbi:MAG: hypothetical protein JO342_08650 [Solirubrobacterales bacterium]|nr:hypothetical protein [Solirubrobacterales bacterium]